MVLRGRPRGNRGRVLLEAIAMLTGSRSCEVVQTRSTGAIEVVEQDRSDSQLWLCSLQSSSVVS